MTEDTKQITADNLRADFLNATTTWQRWEALNKALDWAMAASENAEHWRGKAEEMKRELDGLREKNTQTVTFSVDASAALESIRKEADRRACDGYGKGLPR